VSECLWEMINHSLDFYQIANCIKTIPTTI